MRDLETMSGLEKLTAERDALAAQVEALKSASEKMMFKAKIVSNICYNIGQRHDDAEQILQAVREYDAEARKFHDAISLNAQHHLRKVRADAVLDAVKSCAIVKCFEVPCISVYGLNQYADSIRQGEVK